ncbi:unnamed protein product, partial [Allacma fusca]
MKCHFNFRRLVARVSLLVLVMVIFIEPIALGQSSNSSCVAKKTCGECIRSPDCVWCSQPKFERQDKSPLPRCNTATKHQALSLELRCESDYLINPNHQFQLVKDEEISRGSYSKAAIQIKPQHVSLRMRVGQPYDINMQYAQAEDYPVDLYYLMDLSKSMEDDKEQLSNLGDTLADVMRKLTSNFRLGFGSFVDKVVMPFVSTVEKKLLQPCDDCVSPYGYRNHMTLSSDTTNFS